MGHSIDKISAREVRNQCQQELEDIRDADAAVERIKNGEKTISHNDLKRKLGLRHTHRCHSIAVFLAEYIRL